jgi:hypothetical protein
MDSEMPTNPGISSITVEEQLDYILGTLRRIDAQLASNEPPPWAAKLISDMDHKIMKIETELKNIQSVCKFRHNNGNGSSIHSLF